jgi:hypothetical protein
MRHENYALLQCILEGKIDGKRTRGRRRTSWMSNIRNRLGKNREELIHTAKDRWRYDMLMANLNT